MYELRICSFVSPKVSRIPIYRYKYAIHYQRPMIHPTVRQNHATCLGFFSKMSHFVYGVDSICICSNFCVFVPQVVLENME